MTKSEKKAYLRPRVSTITLSLEVPVKLLACTNATLVVCPDAFPECCAASPFQCDSECPPF